MTMPTTSRPIRIGISGCLLGEKVRYDTGHKKDQFVTETLSNYFEWVSVCPELEVGMGVPREAVRLVQAHGTVSMVGVKSGDDWTDRMNRFSVQRVKALQPLDLSGFILKSKSPSCGMERVRYYADSGMPSSNGPGLFARALMEEYPHLPVEEEGRLNDPHLRENFIERVFCYHRLQNMWQEGFSRDALVRFHTAHKYLLMAHSNRHYQELGRLVANMTKVRPAKLQEEYTAHFMGGLLVKATVKKHVNVLQHIFGYFSDKIAAEERKDILATIDDYHKELVPLIVPITLFRHFVNKLNISYIQGQVYLNPHPKEMMLRNRV